MHSFFNESRARRLMEEAGVSALITGHYPNVIYVTGYESFLLRQGHIVELAVFSLDGGLGLVLPVIEVPRVLDTGAAYLKIYPFGQFFVYDYPGVPTNPLFPEYQRIAGKASPGLRNALADAFRTVAKPARVAFDDMGLNAVGRLEVGQQLQQMGYEVVNGSGLLDRIRMVKTPAEVEVLEEASEITGRAINAAIAEAKVGVSEHRLFEAFRASLQSQDAAVDHWSATSGERGWGLFEPSGRILRSGDLIRVDGGCLYRYYTSDLGCTVGVGEVPAEAVRRYACLEAGFLAAVRAIRPDAMASQVFAEAVAAVQATGIPDYRRHDVGHGLGRGAYELPILRPPNRLNPLFTEDQPDFALEPNMVLNVEIPYYVHGLGGYQLEKTIVVTERGARVLGSSDTRMPRV